MKTAMQELIEYLRSLAFSKCHLGMGDIMLTQGHIDELKEKYLEKEKEQMLDLIRFMRTNNKMGKSVEDLYNEFYNQKN